MSYTIQDQDSGQQYEGHLVDQYVNFPKLAQFFHVEFMEPGEQVFCELFGTVRSFIVL